ncbi:septum site-determining protein Ssd [Nocardiopsis sp. NPDC050513]|uniref:septum site-determining protein Ssd n=1 Tax=Nocardiopsis sp. NPDC050513 TaxID=3364338 RepID=UPI0037BD6432
MAARPLPLLVTDDPALLDDLLRLATAAAVEVTVARSAAQARRAWSRAPLVVVGADLSRAGTPPHPHAVTVAREPECGGIGESDGSGGSGPDRDTPDHASPLLRLPDDEPAIMDLLAGAAARGDPPAPSVAVMGGRGGAGATLTAVAVALAGARADRDTALLDADPLGCGPDVYLGCDLGASVGPDRRTSWDDLLRRDGRVRWRDLRAGLPGTRGVSVLTWARGPGSTDHGALPPEAASAALDSARSGTGLVVVDLPRSFAPATDAFLNRADRAYLVVPADVPSVVAATRVVPRMRAEAPGAGVVVVGAGGELSADVVAQTLGLPLAADLPREPGLARLLAAGRTPARNRRSPLARFADRVVSELSAPERVR